MTVKELIEKLEKIADKEKVVVLEGCDCINAATGILINNKTCLIVVLGHSKEDYKNMAEIS